MKRIFLALALLPFLSLPSFADEGTGSPPVIIGGGGTEVIADDQTGTIRFLIDGEEKAFIDRDGLHVRDDIDYGGSLTDSGTAHFEEVVKAREARDADEKE